jgi:hypothetical protein
MTFYKDLLSEHDADRSEAIDTILKNIPKLVTHV